MYGKHLIVVLGLAACSTDDSQGNGTMTAAINGNLWHARKVTGTRTATTISVGGQSTPNPVVTISGFGVTGPGTYRVTEDLLARSSADFTVWDHNGFAVTQLGGGSGALVIESWSDAEATGSFAFTAGQGSGSHSVSGSFSVTF